MTPAHSLRLLPLALLVAGCAATPPAAPPAASVADGLSLVPASAPAEELAAPEPVRVEPQALALVRCDDGGDGGVMIDGICF